MKRGGVSRAINVFQKYFLVKTIQNHSQTHDQHDHYDHHDHHDHHDHNDLGDHEEVGHSVTYVGIKLLWQLKILKLK